MPEIVFDELDEGAQIEIRQLAADFKWDLEYTVRRYIEAGESLAIQRQLELMRRPPARLALVDHKKALDRD